MIVLAFYLLKVLVCSGVLFLYYHFFLRNKLFHQWNRFYLLFSVIGSVLLPLIKIDLFADQHAQSEVIRYVLIGQSTDHYLDEFIVTNKQSIGMDSWAVIAYSLVSIFFVFSLLFSIYKVVSIIRSHTVKLFHTIKFINTSEKGAPFSFLNYIFWHQDISLQTETGQQIFQHELVHVQEKHTWDKLFMQLVIAFFWCNPFFWLIRKELKYIHEFIADKKAVGKSGTEAFAAMILQSVYPQQFQSITNQFFQQSIKRRIFMLSQLKNPKVAYAGRVIALPVTALLVLSFTIRTKDQANQLPAFDLELITQNDTLPKKPNDIQAIDVNSTKKEITITYKDGRIETLTEKQAREKGMLNNYDNSKNTVVSANGQPSSVIRLKSDGPAPVFFVDGKEITKDAMEKIDPNSIESINVWKGKSATEKFGDKGKDGVVEIKLKKGLPNEPTAHTSNSSNATTANSEVVEVNANNNSNANRNEEIVVKGFRIEEKQSSDNKEITVIGHKIEASTNNSGPVFEKMEFEPSIDRELWEAFLEKYTQPIAEDAAKRGVPSGQYTVLLRFLVEKDGSLSDIAVVKDPGHGIAKKVVEIMKYSPKWKPAIQNQRVVRGYHSQPITFVIGGGAELTKLN